VFLIRVGNDERDACVQKLIDHHLRGRLSADELDRRQHAALNATTAADLAALIADLPIDIGSVDQSASSRSRRRSSAAMSPARRAAVWGGPPVVLLSAATIAASYESYYYNSEEIFATALAAGVVGYVTHWVVARLRRGPGSE
jgi:hypothetical protein